MPKMFAQHAEFSVVTKAAGVARSLALGVRHQLKDML